MSLPDDRPRPSVPDRVVLAAPPPRRRRDGRRGFTVVELLVVVAIVAIVCALIVPAALGRMARRAGSAARIDQEPPRAALIGDGRAPATERADVHIALTARAALDGFRVVSRYQAVFTGTFVIRNRDAAADRLDIAVPFPPGLAEARDVSLGLRIGAVTLPEPDDVVYDTAGIRWTMALPPGEAVTITVSYTGVGRDALRYDVAGAGRTGEVHVAIDVDGADAAVPLDSLEPTGALRWDYEGLVTKRPIVVELSPGASPLGRAIELLRLAGVAVLLFGIGFWYLSALDRRGRLDRFRWGHFLVLALDYMLWFALAATLIVRGSSPALAVAIASVVALPLLALHVTRMLDRRFALTRALPLAVLTLAAALAVVLAHQRAAVLAISLVAIAAGLTLTHRTFLARGEEHRRRRDLRLRRFSVEARRTEQLARLPALELAAAEAGADASATATTAEPAPLIEDVRAAADACAAAHAAAARARAHVEGLDALDDVACVAAGPAAVRAVERAADTLRAAVDTLRVALDTLDDARRAAVAQRRLAASPSHCAACGASGAATPHCAACGAARMLRLPCASCGTELRLAPHLLVRDWQRRAVHCLTCGQRVAA